MRESFVRFQLLLLSIRIPVLTTSTRYTSWEINNFGAGGPNPAVIVQPAWPSALPGSHHQHHNNVQYEIIEALPLKLPHPSTRRAPQAKQQQKKPTSKAASNDQPRICHVCGEQAGKHSYYGGQVCPSCRAFFRRSVQSK